MQPVRASYVFGPFILDKTRRLLLRDGKPVGLTPKEFDIFAVLAGNSGHLVEKDILLASVWPDTVVDENNLTFQISRLRKALGDGNCIVTIPGRGYQLAVPVQVVEGPDASEKKELEYRSITYDRGFVMSARFSPDGSILYGAAWEDRPTELFSSIPGDHLARTLGITNADVLAVSPSTELAISLGRHFTGGAMTSGTLARLFLGCAPREICEDVSYADWSPDGRSLAIIRRAGDLFVIEFPPGRRIYETPHWLSHLRISPKGDLIALLDHPRWYDDAGYASIIDLHGQPRLRSRAWMTMSGLAWTPQGDEVWFAAADAPLSGRGLVGLSLAGRERSVLPIPGKLTLHDISRTGDVVVSYEHGRREMMSGKKGVQGERDLSWFHWSHPTGISADGSRIVFEEHSRSRQGKLPGTYMPGRFIRETDGTPPVYAGDGRVRGFSPDGRWIAGLTESGDHLELLTPGIGQSRLIPCRGLEVLGWWYWFPDGQRLLLWGNEPGRGNRMYELSIEVDKALRPIGPEGTEFPMAISPNGTELAATSPDGRLMIYSTEGDRDARAVPSARRDDRALLWGSDGWLFVYQPGRLRVPIERIDLETGERLLWHEIRPADPAGVTVIDPLLLAADRQSYVYGYRRMLCELYVIKGLL